MVRCRPAVQELGTDQQGVGLQQVVQIRVRGIEWHVATKAGVHCPGQWVVCSQHTTVVQFTLATEIIHLIEMQIQVRLQLCSRTAEPHSRRCC